MTNESDSLGCLAFYLRHAADVSWVLAAGPTIHQKPDWANLERVVALAQQQAADLLLDLLQDGKHELRNVAVRVETTTRPTTASRRLFAAAELRLPGQRRLFAYLGVSLGLDDRRLSLYLGHAARRFVNGPALAERLRVAGTSVVVADGRSATRSWPRGTIVLDQLEFFDGCRRDTLKEFARETIRTKLVEKWGHVVAAGID